ncbi:MAG: hypothetical protein ABSF76_14495 [Opitutaceae bacterium]|jgi:hypothetical protein
MKTFIITLVLAVSVANPGKAALADEARRGLPVKEGSLPGVVAKNTRGPGQNPGTPGKGGTAGRLVSAPAPAPPKGGTSTRLKPTAPTPLARTGLGTTGAKAVRNRAVIDGTTIRKPLIRAEPGK